MSGRFRVTAWSLLALLVLAATTPPLRADLVAHWPLDEGEGDEFANLADANFDGFLFDPTVLVNWVLVEPNLDGTGPDQEFAVEFTGTNSWVHTDYPGIEGANPRTVACWIKTTATNTHGIVAWGNSGANGAKWHFRVNNSAANGVVGAIRTEPQGGQNVATTIINDGQWHHVAAVFPDGATTSSEIRHYVDGIFDPQSGGGDRAIDTQIFPIGDPVSIGSRVQGANRHFFPGQVADVRIYDEALDDLAIRELAGLPPPVPCESATMVCTPDEVLNTLQIEFDAVPVDCLCPQVEIFVNDTSIGLRGVDASGLVDMRLDEVCVLNPGEDVTIRATCVDTEISAECVVSCPARQGLVARWPLDEGAGDFFEDALGNFDGTLLPASTIQWVDGPPTQEFAVEFDGIASGIDTPFEGIAGAYPRTVAFWMRTTTTGNHTIVGWGDSTRNSTKWHVRLNDNAGNGVLRALRTENQGGQNVASTPLNDGQWHHVAAVFPEGATGVSEVLHFVDGLLDPRSGGGNIAMTTDIGPDGDPVTIGYSFQGANPRFYEGALADVRIYDEALDADELLEIMSGGRCLARRALDTSPYLPGSTIDVEVTAVNISGTTTVTETFPAGLSVSNAGGGTVDGNSITFELTEDSVLSYTLSVPDTFCETITLSGNFASGDDDCEGVTIGNTTVPCGTGCSELQASGAPSMMLVIGPIAAGMNTGPQCDDNGNLGLVDYLVEADGSGSEEDIAVVTGDEIQPDFGGLAAGAGVGAAANTDINPRRDEGILTAFLAETDPDGAISFDSPLVIGALDDYIVYTQVYLVNTTDEDLPVTLRVGSDDAIRVLLNGEQVFLNPICRGVPPLDAADRVPVTLFPGVNNVLITVVERAGGSGVRLAVYDEFDFAPVDDGSVVACLSPSGFEPPDDSPVFKRGDVDGNGAVDISDPILNLSGQFLGAELPCLDAADFNDTGAVDISDPIANLTNQFLGGPPAAPPGSGACGPDPTPDPGADDGVDLGCEAYPPASCNN